MTTDIDSPFTSTRPLAYGSPAPVQVLKQLRELIANGVTPGTQLPSEQMLARQFGVSKNVIREAIKVLSAQGFVAVKHGIRTRVKDRSQWNIFDPEVLLAIQGLATFEHLTDVRRLLEPEIAARAAARASERDVIRIHEMLRTERRDIEEQVSTDVEFHRRIAEAGKNPLLVILLDSLGILLAEGRRVMYGIPGAVERALAQHQRIYDAIAGRDVEGARSAMAAHIEEIAADLKSLNRIV
jgi:DNA-binding FadR family transcriptional regulator